MTTVLPPETRQGRSLISRSLMRRLTARVAADHGLDLGLAERIVDQAAAFVATCGTTAGQAMAMSPSSLVDIGWHTFIWLDTRAYHEFCDRVCGRYIHHIAHESVTPRQHPIPAVSTTEAIRRAGFVVDEELWPSMASCGPCHEDGNCSSSGKDGNENTDNRKKFATTLP